MRLTRRSTGTRRYVPSTRRAPVAARRLPCIVRPRILASSELLAGECLLPIVLTTRPLALLYLCTLTLAGCATAPAPATLRVLSVGTYSVKEVATTEQLARTPAEKAIGFRYVGEVVLIDSSTRIPLVSKARFGVVYVLEGLRQGDQYKCHVAWRYPPPGFLASNGERVLSEELDTVLTADWVDSKGFYLDESIERYPEGTYTVEIFVGKQLILQQSFELTRPSLVESK